MSRPKPGWPPVDAPRRRNCSPPAGRQVARARRRRWPCRQAYRARTRFTRPHYLRCHVIRPPPPRVATCQISTTSISSSFDGAAAFDGAVAFDCSRPIASCNGRLLVLELRRETCAAAPTPPRSASAFCTARWQATDAVVLPLLSGEDKPTADCGCALLTGDDLHPRRGAKFFSFRLLLIVYNDRLLDYTCNPSRTQQKCRTEQSKARAETEH